MLSASFVIFYFALCLLICKDCEIVMIPLFHFIKHYMLNNLVSHTDKISFSLPKIAIVIDFQSKKSCLSNCTEDLLLSNIFF